MVGVLTRPQSGTDESYSVKLSPANRYGGFKAVRERWKARVESSLLRPVLLLLLDKAQEMQTEVLSELRILASANFLDFAPYGRARRRRPPRISFGTRRSFRREVTSVCASSWSR